MSVPSVPSVPSGFPGGRRGFLTVARSMAAEGLTLRAIERELRTAGYPISARQLARLGVRTLHGPGRPRKLGAEHIVTAANVIDRGGTLDDAAKALSVHPGTLATTARRYRATPLRTPRRAPIFTDPERLDELATLARAGVKRRDLAAHFACSVTTISRHVTALGVPLTRGPYATRPKAN